MKIALHRLNENWISLIEWKSNFIDWMKIEFDVLQKHLTFDKIWLTIPYMFAPHKGVGPSHIFRRYDVRRNVGITRKIVAGAYYTVAGWLVVWVISWTGLNVSLYTCVLCNGRYIMYVPLYVTHSVLTPLSVYHWLSPTLIHSSMWAIKYSKACFERPLFWETNLFWRLVYSFI